MHEIYELKEMLMQELEEYGRKGELKDVGSLEIIDKLAHTIKNLCKIIEAAEEEEYSNNGGSYRGSSRDGYRGSYRGSYRGGSYARGRGSSRDSMGRYSSEGYSRTGEIADRLRDLMTEAPDERTRQEIQNLASRMEMM